MENQPPAVLQFHADGPTTPKKSSMSAVNRLVAAAVAPPLATKKEPSPTKMVLAPFRPAPCLSFGNVRMGGRKQMPLVVDNPNVLSDELSFQMDTAAHGKGFRLVSSSVEEAFEDEDIQVPSNSTLKLVFEWTPQQPGAVRASVTVRSSISGQRFQLFLLGFAVAQVAGKPTGDAAEKRKNLVSQLTIEKPVSTCQDASKRKALEPLMTKDIPKRPTIPGKSIATTVAASPVKEKPLVKKPSLRSRNKLQLSKSANASQMNFRPLSYASRNDMYDENWVDKQERSFTKWLNYELLGGDWSFTSKDTSSSLDHFSKNLKREHVRQAASLLYQSESFKLVLEKLDIVRGSDTIMTQDG